MQMPSSNDISARNESIVMIAINVADSFGVCAAASDGYGVTDTEGDASDGAVGAESVGGKEIVETGKGDEIVGGGRVTEKTEGIDSGRADETELGVPVSVVGRDVAGVSGGLGGMIITPAIDDEGDKKIGDELGSQEGATPGAVVDVVVNGSSGTVATVTEVGRGTLGGNVPITPYSEPQYLAMKPLGWKTLPDKPRGGWILSNTWWAGTRAALIGLLCAEASIDINDARHYIISWERNRSTPDENQFSRGSEKKYNERDDMNRRKDVQRARGDDPHLTTLSFKPKRRKRQQKNKPARRGEKTQSQRNQGNYQENVHCLCTGYWLG
ncbi:hypothetical protein PAXINDRAFT_152032 [Paxillus involutus ATCC 200175]|nr:hypothetical protein PAXINDRAFT_152032 [Paxillus involutus ATCC 200175]